MCFSKTGAFSFPFGYVFIVTDWENKFNSLGTMELVLAVFFSYETRSIEDFFSDSKAPGMLFEQEQVLYQWVDVILTIMLGVYKLVV